MILSDLDVGPLLLDQTFPFKLTSGNSGQGWSYHASDNQRKKFGEYFANSSCKRTPFGYPTFVVVTRILGKGEKHFDYPNISRGNIKQIIDAMVAEGRFWHDDGPKCITGIYFRQDDRDRKSGPATRFQVWKSGDTELDPREFNTVANRRCKIGTVKAAQRKTRRSRRKKSKYK